MARLYTNATDRQAFYNDPAQVGRAWSLETNEIQRILPVDRCEIERFARSLAAKRRGQVQKILPRTCGALGEALPSLFWIYAASFVPSGIDKHDIDAAAFARFILKYIRGAAGAGGTHGDDQDSPSLVPVSAEFTAQTRDLVRWELATLEVRITRKPRLLYLRCGFPAVEVTAMGSPQSCANRLPGPSATPRPPQSKMRPRLLLLLPARPGPAAAGGCRMLHIG